MTATSIPFNTQVNNNRVAAELAMKLGLQSNVIADFYENGDSEVKQFLKNVVWLATAATMKYKGLIAGLDKISLEKINFEIVDEEMILAAIYGCSNILQCVAKTKQASTAQITFPRKITAYRKSLLSEISDRTFHCKIKGTESHWFEWADRFIDKLVFSIDAQNVINKIIIKTKVSPINTQ